PPDLVAGIARVIVLGRVVLDAEAVLVVGVRRRGAVSGALLGQPLAAAVEAEVVAVALLVIDGVPRERVREHARVAAPAGARKDAVESGGEVREFELRARICGPGRMRIEDEEIEDRVQELVGAGHPLEQPRFPTGWHVGLDPANRSERPLITP